MQRSDRRIGFLIGASLLGLYLTVQYGDLLTYDGRIMANVTHNLLDHGRLVVTHDVAWAIPDKGLHTSQYGIGVSLLLLPFWAVQRAVNPDDTIWLTLANPIVTAVTAAVVFHIGVALGWRRLSALIAAFTFGVFTMAPNYSTDLFSEPSVALCVAVALLGLIRWREGRASGPLLLGVACATAALFRIDSFVTVAPVMATVLLFVPIHRLRATWRQWLPRIALPMIVAVAWTLFYNALRYTSPLDFGASANNFHNPVLEGLQRQLFSTGKGLFWYDPVLIAALPGLYLLVRRRRAEGVMIIGLFALRALYFAHWDFPDGSVAWGPRFLVPVCPLLALGVGELVERLPGWRAGARVAVTSGVGALAVAGIVVGVASLWVPYPYSYDKVTDIPNAQQRPGAELDAIKARRYDRLFNDWYWSPILVNLRAVGDPSPLVARFPMRWWRDGGSPVGALTLGAGLAAGFVAADLTRVNRRREPSGRWRP